MKLDDLVDQCTTLHGKATEFVADVGNAHCANTLKHAKDNLDQLTDVTGGMCGGSSYQYIPNQDEMKKWPTFSDWMKTTFMKEIICEV